MTVFLVNLLYGLLDAILFALAIGFFLKLRLYFKLSKMNGEYEGEEIDPDSNKSHEEKTYTVNFSLWNFLRLKNLLVIKQHYTGSSNEDYLRDWESRFYVPEFNYLFLHGHYEYQGDYDDWGFHNIQLNPNKQEIAVELISKNKESEGKYLLKKVD